MTRDEAFQLRRGLAEAIYVDAQQRGRQNVVIFILDLTDENAKQAAIALSSPEQVSQYLAECERASAPPVIALDQLAEPAETLLNPWPKSAAGIGLCLEAGKVPVVILGDSGISVRGMPKPNPPKSVPDAE